MPDRHLVRLFLQRFIENDLIAPDADRAQVFSQAGAAIITGGLFVSIFLSLPYLNAPYPLPSRTAANVIRVQFLYAAWSMTVMALVAIAVWDALALDHRDTEILGPLPVRRSVIARAKVSAVIVFAAGFAAALNVVPALIHPVVALSRLRPSVLHVAALVAAHIASTTAAAAFGFLMVLAVRELLYAALGARAFRQVAIVIRAVLVVALVTTLLLIPVMSFKVANLWFHGAVTTKLLPPMWFAGLHDLLSGYVWSQLPRPDLPPSLALSERAFEYMYQTRRPVLQQLAVTGGVTFAVVLVASTAAYWWNNRRLPEPASARAAERRIVSAVFDLLAGRLIARRPLIRAGYFFTMRVLARSVQNRLSLGIPLAVAIAVAVVSLVLAGLGSSRDLSRMPVALSAVQFLFVTALVMGFRHSVRVPADLRARWIFHLIRPANHMTYMAGIKRAAVLKLVLPVLLILLPLHIVAFGRQAALVHLMYGLLYALVVNEGCLLGYRHLPFASSYVPQGSMTTHGGIYAFVLVAALYIVAWLEHVALSTATGTVVLFVVTAILFAVIRALDVWQRRERREVELDEVVDPPTLRLGLME